MASSKTEKLKLFSSASIFSGLARVVGLTEITPQYSGMLAAKSYTPISRDKSIMSGLSIAISGRSTSVSVTESITVRLRNVWLDTWAILSPVTMASIFNSFATWLPALSIIRLRITPICELSTFSKISLTTPSKGTVTNLTPWDTA